MTGAPPAPAPVLQAPPVVASPAPPRPIDSEETHARKEIESLVSAYCAALQAMDPAAILRMMPRASPDAVQKRLAGYKSLKCTVTLPAEFDRIDIDAAGSGRAQLRFRMSQEYVLREGPRLSSDTIARVTASRRDRTSPWVIDSLVHEPRPK
jgi:hypothetical protein